MLPQAIENPAPNLNKNAGWMSQFRYPRGWRGWLVGQLMAIKNKQRSLWVLSLLDLGPAERVLEIGFGPGADIRRVAVRVPEGFVAGIDHSEAMVRLATFKNRRAIGAGRVSLRLGAASDLPYEADSFDVVFSINVAQFWERPDAVAREIRRVMKSGGRVALAVQPRSKGANEATVRATGEKLVEALTTAGFQSVRLERKVMEPVAVICALSKK